MTTTKFVLKAIALVAVLAPCIATLASAYRRDNLVITGGLHIATGPAATALQCKRTLRVVNVGKQDVLNLRELPSPQAPIRLGIPADARGLIDLRERNGVWRRIEFGASGWVNSAFVTDDVVVCLPDPAAPATGPRSRHPLDALSTTQPVT
jgi:hypothetical protein